jgi:hypothetical protein
MPATLGSETKVSFFPYVQIMFSVMILYLSLEAGVNKRVRKGIKQIPFFYLLYATYFLNLKLYFHLIII